MRLMSGPAARVADLPLLSDVRAEKLGHGKHNHLSATGTDSFFWESRNL